MPPFVPFSSGDQLERLAMRKSTLDSFIGRTQSNIRNFAAGVEARINALFGGSTQGTSTVQNGAAQVLNDIVNLPSTIIGKGQKIVKEGGNVINSFLGGVGNTVKDTAKSLNRTIIIVFVAAAVIIVLGLVLVKRT